MRMKAQVTMYLIIGIILLGIVVVATSFKKANIEQPLQINDDQLIVQQYLESCLHTVATKAVYTVSFQGGYYDPFPNGRISYFNAEIPYYWDSESLVPSIQEIEGEIGLYIFDAFEACVNDFEVLKAQGLTVEKLPIEEPDLALTTLNEEDISVELPYPIKISRGENTYSLDRISTSVSLPLLRAYSLAAQIIEEQKKDAQHLPIGYISALAYQNGFTFELIKYDDNTYIVSLILDIPNDNDLIFAFANRYDWVNNELE